LKLYPENIYHIYNRGNNRQKIFFSKKNYLFFLRKMRVEIKPYVDIISYCLMPNHFHILISTFNEFEQEKFSNGFKTLLSSYTKAINIQEKRVGSLFQQNSKAKCLTALTNYKNNNYGLICFNYIHQNPVNASLVKKMEDWEYSSYCDYSGIRNGTMCNKNIAYEIVGIPKNVKEFIKVTNELPDVRKIRYIF